ncbi:MAG: TonB-dependent receptor [Bacteroidetes bacterium]|nr:TonB-dependent receptor [Bacteroidota bacterium]MBS1973793.1 TonB-dependent receptor [Bacteroidota bacterium]
MKKPIAILTIVLFASLKTYAQHSSISGTISDTTEKKILPNSSVLILRKADSVLVFFTRSGRSGEFMATSLPSGKFIVLITYPKYADYVDTVSISDSSTVRLGIIPLTQKAQLLKEVVVRQKIGSIKIKGDTTEFAADSFKVQPNATVEDLLKKMPGIQVDKNGQITAQGEKVQKILVDGEEFFGDDPTLVTQNLRADMVDKVQVYDKKSDQAAFTGIDDGQKQKTINLKLKEGKKNGYFGKINASAGTNGYHDNQLMFNHFKDKQKFALYGIVSNTGTSGLNWQDQNNYGDNPLGNVDYDQNNGYFILEGSGDELDSWNGQYNGQGYPLVQTGGLHYNNKWNDDKQSLNANYKILQLNVTGGSTTNSQFILPDTFYYNNSKQQFTNRILRNRASGNYELQIDSSSSVKINADGGMDHKTTYSVDSTEARASDSALINQGFNRTTSTDDKHVVNSNLLWRKKLKKKGRTLSFNLRENYTANNSSGFLYADNYFYAGGSLSQSQVTDQYKTNQSKNLLLDSKLTYTEPLTKVSSLIFNYGIVVNNSNSSVSSFNKDNTGKYTALDTVYSNDYVFNIFTHRAGASYSLFQKKFKFSIGSDAGFANFNQKNEMTDSAAHRSFVNWYPQTTLMYQFSQSRSIHFRYNGYSQQPSIQQIQPVATNKDPLNIAIGNPNLKPEFSNNMSLSYNDYKIISDRFIWASANYSFIQNNISTSYYVDSFGRRVNQSVNLNGSKSFSVNGNYGIKIRKIDTRLGFNGNYNFNRNVSIVNNILNTTNSNNYTMGMNLSKSKEKKYELNLSASATYTSSYSTVQQGIATKYWTFDINPNFDFFLPLKLQVHSDCDMNIRQKTPVFNTNTSVIIWNAWIGKKLLKNDALIIKIIGNDLLDQNIGFSRSVNSNFISQNTYSTIRRYFLLGITWNFTKAGTKMPGQSE